MDEETRNCLEEWEEWDRERKEKRWMDAHPNAVKEFLDAIRKTKKDLATFRNRDVTDRKTARKIIRSLEKVIGSLKAYKGELEKVK